MDIVTIFLTIILPLADSGSYKHAFPMSINTDFKAVIHGALYGSWVDEMYRPRATFVKAAELSPEALVEAENDPNVKVIHEHVFSNGERIIYVTIDGLVVSADVILATVEEMQLIINQYEKDINNPTIDIPRADISIWKPNP